MDRQPLVDIGNINLSWPATKMDNALAPPNEMFSCLLDPHLRDKFVPAPSTWRHSPSNEHDPFTQSRLLSRRRDVLTHSDL